MNNKTRISFIGAGRVGTSFGKYLSNSGFKVIGYYSKSQSSAYESAEFIGSGCTAFDNIKDLAALSNIVFITTNDDSIKAVCTELCCLDKEVLNGKVFCHTSGSLSSEILKPLQAFGCKTASLHMLLAVSDKFKSYSDFEKAFFTLEGNGSNKILEVIQVCGNECRVIESQYKAKYHAAAVFVSNFVVALSHIGCTLLTECGFSYNDAVSALSPLIELNVQNIISQGPQNALTGPIERGDFETVKKHLGCFSDTETDAVAKDVYKSLSKALIWQTGNIPDIETHNKLK
ncbi:MAG: DUF2520 domain-containing protein [Clostridiales bacterium]|nr:DUF2520 domain-containing protein [Clostridiales bacterium]